jgi:hypothetical protein
MASKLNSYSSKDRKAAGGAQRRQWKRLDSEEVWIEAGQFECEHCGGDIEGGDPAISRGEVDSGEPVFCSVACGVFYEREQDRAAIYEHPRSIFAFEGVIR